MMFKEVIFLFCAACLFSCASAKKEQTSLTEPGRIEFSIELGKIAPEDLEGYHFAVVDRKTGDSVMITNVRLSEQNGMFVAVLSVGLAPGDYDVRATPARVFGETDGFTARDDCPIIQHTAVEVISGNVSVLENQEGDCPRNKAPKVASITWNPPGLVQKGEQIQITLNVEDEEGDKLTFAWEVVGEGCTGQFFDENDRDPMFRPDISLAPFCDLQVTVSDGRGRPERAVVRVPKEGVDLANRPPEIDELEAVPEHIDRGGSTKLTLVANDPNGDPLTYRWTVEGCTGEFKPNDRVADPVFIPASSAAVSCTLGVTVQDIRESSDTANIVVTKTPVKAPVRFGDLYSTGGGGENHYAPAMAISHRGDSSVVYHLAYYQRFGPLAQQEVYYARSTAGGKEGTWSVAIPVSSQIEAGHISETARDVDVAAKGGFVIIVWQQNRRIYAAHSEDAGITFQDAQEISIGETGFRRLPKVAIDNSGRIHVVWSESQTIAYVTSDDGDPGSWSKPEVAIGKPHFHPAIAVDDTNIYVGAQQLTVDSIEVRRKPLSPTILWDDVPSAVRVYKLSEESGDTAYHTYLDFAVDSAQNLYLIFTDNLSLGPNDRPAMDDKMARGSPVFVSTSLAKDRGAVFSKPVQISSNLGGGYLPAISVYQDPDTNEEELHAVWQGNVELDSGMKGFQVQFLRGLVPGNSAGLWDKPDPPQVLSHTASAIHFNDLWTKVDFFLGLPNLLSDNGVTTAFWVNTGTRIQLVQTTAPSSEK